MLFKEKYFTYSEREEPKFPFKYMKIVWLYTLKPEGVALANGSQTGLLACGNDLDSAFEMDEKAKFSDQQVEGFINKHSKDNLKIFKEVIEREAKK